MSKIVLQLEDNKTEDSSVIGLDSLPEYVKEDIENLEKSYALEKAGMPDYRLDVCFDAVNSDINCLEVDGVISSDYAWYLREKCLGRSKKKHGDFMTEIIDFTNCNVRHKSYGGANGNKLCIVYNGEQYMLKFPSPSMRNKNISYTNGTVSEYLGCHILSSVGFETQETLLGTYNVSGKEKIVVACKDFTENKYVVQDFASLKNTVIDSGHNGTGTDLNEILETIDKQQAYNPKMLKEYFWNLFIGDALIGNWDRHNGNWGSLYNPQDDSLRLAPIFDCGNSMYPSIDSEMIKLVMNNKDEFLFRIYEIPFSAFKLNDKKIKYFDFINSLQNEDCNVALKRIYPKINMDKINKIIDETPFITDDFKQFYKTILAARKELILKKSYNKLLSRENTKIISKNIHNVSSKKKPKSLSPDDRFGRS